MQQEIWKDVVGYEEYFQISSFGRVLGKRTNKILSTSSPKGYEILSSRIGGRQGKNVAFRIHRLVAEAFLPAPSDELIEESKNWHYKVIPVNHIDGNKLNNKVDNLEWCSHSYNTIHAIELGLREFKNGEENHSSKLTQNDVNKIRETYVPRSRIYGTRALAIKYGVHHTTISRILREVHYKS